MIYSENNMTIEIIIHNEIIYNLTMIIIILTMILFLYIIIRIGVMTLEWTK